MIEIGKPYIEIADGKAFLKARLSVSESAYREWLKIPEKVKSPVWRLHEDYPPEVWANDDFTLWFCVEERFASNLCCDRADAFVVAVIFYAMLTGSDIRCEAPISQKLYRGLTEKLIPTLLNEESGFSPIELLCQTTDEPVTNHGGVATGMSCGVDSLYTLKRFTDLVKEGEHRLSYLTYFDMGAIFHADYPEHNDKPLSQFNDKVLKIALQKYENAKAVAGMMGMPLVFVQSNMDRDLYRGAYGYSAVYRNCAMALALQGLLRTYYCSSLGVPDYKNYNILKGSEYYEDLLCEAFSTESLIFLLSDQETRYEKTRAIADEEYSKRYLDVCYNFNSCGECAKCMRTMVALDLLGKLNMYDKVFDLPKFRREREKVYQWIVEMNNSTDVHEQTLQSKELFRIAVCQGVLSPEGKLLH